MRILMISDVGPASTSFIKQDVKQIAAEHDLKYIATVQHKVDGLDTIKSDYIPYPFSSLKSRINWRLEKLQMKCKWYDKKFSNQLKASIEEFKPDIIHCQFGYESLKYFDNAFIKDIPVIISFRGYDASYKLSNKAYVKRIKEILSLPNVYSTFVCEYLKNRIENKGISVERSSVIYTGIDTEFFKRKNFNKISDKSIFLQVSSFNEKKGHLFTIRAFDHFIKNNKQAKASLIFVGEGKYLDKSKTLVSQLNLNDLVVFKGKKDREEIRALMDIADVFVHHSITASNGDEEGIPNSIAEAMSMQLPIISTYHAGIPELVENERNGILISEKDVLQYSKAMKDILLFGYLEENRRKILDKFTLEHHMDQIFNLYKSINNKGFG